MVQPGRETGHDGLEGTLLLLAQTDLHHELESNLIIVVVCTVVIIIILILILVLMLILA